MLIQRYTILLISVIIFVVSSITLLIISISSDYWKYVKVMKTNKTSQIMQQISHSGLFHTCYTLSLIEKKSGCEPISLPNVENTSDNNAINSYYITLLSLIFPVASALTLILATCACVYGFWSHKRRSSLLFASLFYVTAGLLNVVGLMCYINRTNDELGPSNKKENIVQEYEYAWSFYMATISFGFTEVSAVLCIYFYNELLRLAKQLTAKRDLRNGGKLLETHHSDGAPRYDETLEGAEMYCPPPLSGAISCVNQFSSMSNFMTNNNINHITNNVPMPPGPPMYHQTQANANFHNLHNQANPIQHQPTAMTSSVSSRPSSVVAMIPMSTGPPPSTHGIPPSAAGPYSMTSSTCCKGVNSISMLTDPSCHNSSSNDFAPVIVAQQANDVISLAPIHPQPIRVQQQNSVSSTASSPPQGLPQHLASTAGSMVGYCNGNPPGGTLSIITTATPPQVITPLNRTSSKPYMVNDTVV